MQNLIKKIQELVPATDKLAHFYTGFLLAFVTFLVYVLVNKLFRFNEYYLIMLPSLLIGVYKELVYDKKHSGFTEFWDVFYTVLPSIVFVFIIYIIDL